MVNADTGRHPWVKWFWSDWRGDEKLGLCSLEARGLWVEILSLIDKSERPGYLLVDGKPPTVPQLARLTRAHWRVVRRCIGELIDRHVCSQDDDGCLYSRRLVREAKRRAIARENGLNGGNPALTGLTKKVGRCLTGIDGGPVNPQKPEARSQKPIVLRTDQLSPDFNAAADFLDTYREVYAKVRSGASYPPLCPSPKLVQAAEAAAAQYERERWPALVEVFLRMDAKQINGMNRPGTIPQFLVMAPEADTLLRQVGR